ncbi:hypothetical protein AB3S75_011452 [Citrus x aurantiifolia]
MNKSSQISLLKSLLKNPFQSSPKPTSPCSLNGITQQLAFNSVLIPNSNSTQLGPDSVPFSTLHSFPHSEPFPHLVKSHQNPRSCYSSESGAQSGKGFDYNGEVDMINLKFAEAREEIEMAMESKETLYFDEEAECARAAVKEVLDLFNGLLCKLRESEKEALQRSMGLKIEQLKAELQQLDD